MFAQLDGGLSFFQHGCEVRAFKPRDEFLLRLAPHRAQGTVILEEARACIAHAFVELDGTVDGFDDFEEGDVFGITREGDAAARAA